ncbi:DMT family transporter [Ahrensia kielensis]|uniref:DMT family transporter n=1 Tax=Ahrensia kielensis TaxID=76980 RepID=UPI0003642127|nr:DMT family transporter [Ahrensia kielensis]
MNKTMLVKAALIMSFGMMFIPAGDTAGKWMTSGMTQQGAIAPVFVAWSRFALGSLLIIAAYAGRQFNFKIMTDWRIWLRGIFLMLGVVCILTALSTTPIADVFAAFFIGPIISYFLAGWLLKEPISGTRTALLFVGFCGVLLVVKPGFGLTIGHVWAVTAGLLYGCFLVSTKWLSHLSNSRSLLLSNLVVGAVLLAPWGIPETPQIDFNIGMLVFLSAAFSAIGNLLYVTATKMADASRLAPLVYVQLLSATILGIIIFDTVPDHLSLFGLALLLATGFIGFALRQTKKPSKAV